MAQAAEDVNVVHDDADLAFERNKMDFHSFLTDHETAEGKSYKDRLPDLLEAGHTRLIVSFNELVRASGPDQTVNAEKFLANPKAFLWAWESALLEQAQEIQPTVKEMKLGFDGSFGSHHLSPRTLTSEYISSLVCVDGIVTKSTLVRPKIVQSVHYCKATKKFTTQEYREATSMKPGPPTGSTYPTKDDDGNLLTTEYGLSVYKDSQTFAVQEMPERAPPGQLPRSADVLLEGDLVDRCKPGDRVRVVGTYMTLAGRVQGHHNGVFRTMIVANNVILISKESLMPKLSDRDVANIRKMAQRKNIFTLLANSIAPSIFGHARIKQAILLMLLGGVEKNLANGAHLRGDINVLMVGDPSTAKSQLLRFIMSIAPLAVSTSGRGSTGVGLTAAVTQDADSGDRRLEAGAMVLADRGVVCIDEFDKMTEQDRTAIHEVMEQQTVTIAKAGIYASLNARCSVAAAANPVYGHYNPKETPTKNIGLPDSLLSRFDLLFIVLDRRDAETDRHISDQVLRNHQYRAIGEEEVLSLHDTPSQFILEKEIERDETPIFEKADRLLHRGRSLRGKNELLSVDFLKSYIHFARTHISPILTTEASALISDTYADLRAKSTEKSLPITARTLETLIRLASAHAKARLSHRIVEADAKAACAIVTFALQNDDEGNLLQNHARRGNDGGGDDDDDEGGDEDGSESPRKRKSPSKAARPSPAKRARRLTQLDEAAEELPAAGGVGGAAPMDVVDVVDFASISADRVKLFMDNLYRVDSNSRTVTEVLPMLNARIGGHAPFSTAEATAILTDMATPKSRDATALINFVDNIIFL
eukprot:gnl/Hemi2/16879_TR5613_c0_g1_i1.p1 gnl/Hemi2/16879_TR5613_c0_g1~~gnl/Hemi2/16879_TR5613_c0_g1_i1.p1  ORF type:complete len:818 (+),score=225.46 gnl/Hemi2/16879_TR5613_c0_g1_i1:87-2540(+)